MTTKMNERHYVRILNEILAINDTEENIRKQMFADNYTENTDWNFIDEDQWKEATKYKVD